MKFQYAKKHFNKWRIHILAILLISAHAIFAQSSGEVVNLGLYGGASHDFSWAYSTNRLFSTVETPASVFYSDDTCATWTQPFPIDSLEYTTDGVRRGWGGGGLRIVTNRTGWVALQTAEQGGTLTSSVVSYNHGDSGTFSTIYDGYLLHQTDPSFSENASTSAIDLSDSWVYVAISNALVRMNDTSTYGPHNILVKLDTVTGIGTHTHINWLAVSGDASGYPMLLVANTPGDQYGNLYRFDGTSFTEITGIPSTYGFERIFIHPLDYSLDTLIVSALQKTGSQRKIFRSLDSGTSWTDITPGGFGVNWPLQNADYNPDWVSQMPSGNGLRLSFPGVEKSDNLGNTWSSHMLEDNASATHPVDTSYVVGSINKGPQLSINGAMGTFASAPNVGHAAVSITKIAQKDTDVYYVATKAGLGYTDAYKDPTVVGVDQWIPPHGDFPINGVGTDAGVFSVAIDPNDELHVVAGSTNGFYVTTTGASGFSWVLPSGWDSGSQLDFRVNDIKFITSDTIVATTGHGDNVNLQPSYEYGNIWMSYDGGASWSKTAPSDTDDSGSPVYFREGNTVVVGFGTSDTIIYIGAGYWQDTPKDDGQLWKSDDMGSTWSFVNYGPTGQNGGELRMKIYDMDIHPDPDSNQVLYMASGENLDYAFCRTTDGGVTYTYLDVSGEGAFSSVLVTKSSPNIISVAARRNLFRYNRILASTTTVFNGLPGEFVPDLETGSTLLGTTTGLYKLDETPGSVLTIWNGMGDWTDVSKWSNGIPYDNSDVVIESGKVNVDYSGSINNLTMEPQSSMTVAAGIDLTVAGNLLLNSDESGYASFINEGTFTVNGEVNIEKILTQDQWHYITPPVSNSTANDFFGIYLKYWDEVSNQWTYITEPTEELIAGKGYSAWSSSSTTGNAIITFSGTINSGDYSPALTLSGDPGLDYGWNLVGNEFPSAIDWGTDNDPNPELIFSNIDNTLYFWTGSQYATYNPSGNGGDGLGTNGATRYIASAQGFYIHANAPGPGLTIPQSTRVHDTQPFMAPQTLTDNQLKLLVDSDTYSDETVVAFNDQSHNAFDPNYDAYKLDGIEVAPQLYSFFENEKLAVNTLPFEEDTMDIPVFFEAGTPGTHALLSIGMDGFPDDVYIQLEDKLEGIVIDLRDQPEYTFYGSPSDLPDRFILHFDATTLGEKEVDTPDNILIYGSPGQLFIENTKGDIVNGRIQVFNTLGEMIFDSELNGESKYSIQAIFNTGAYLVVLTSEKSVKTKKLLINR